MVSKLRLIIRNLATRRVYLREIWEMVLLWPNPMICLSGNCGPKTCISCWAEMLAALACIILTNGGLRKCVFLGQSVHVGLSRLDR